MSLCVTGSGLFFAKRNIKFSILFLPSHGRFARAFDDSYFSTAFCVCTYSTVKKKNVTENSNIFTIVYSVLIFLVVTIPLFSHRLFFAFLRFSIQPTIFRPIFSINIVLYLNAGSVIMANTTNNIMHFVDIPRIANKSPR